MAWVRAGSRAVAAGILTLTALTVLIQAGPAGAEPVTVRAGVHEGYGRLVLTWPSPVRFEAAADDGRLTLRFARPAEADYAAATKALAAYLGPAEPSADGRTVSFPLVQPVNVRSFDLGASAVVDLVRRDVAETAATATAKPDEPPPTGSPEGPPRVPVRIGDHPGFSRIVFDWPERVDFEAGKVGTTATVTFASPARMDLTAVSGDAVRRISAASAAAKDDATVVALTIPENSRLRTTRHGPKVVVDVMAPADDKAPASETAAPSPDVNAPTTHKEFPPPPPKAPPPVADATADTSKARSEAEPAPVPANTAPPELRQATEPEAPSDAPPATPVLAVEEEPLAPPDGGLALRFEWPAPAAAAVFERAGYLWMVFNRIDGPNVAALQTAAGGRLKGLQSLPAEDATVMRLPIAEGTHATVRRDGLAWIVDLAEAPPAAAEPLEVRTRTSPSGASRLVLSVPEPGRPIAIGDPEVGDTLVAVPVIPLGRGIFRPREYTDLHLLPTVQGVVVRPRVDGLRVRSSREGIELSAMGGGGLRVTAVRESEQAGARVATTDTLGRVLDLERWAVDERTAFRPKRRRLEDAVAEAADDVREDARLNLSRFYVANGYAAEAVGVLKRLERARPGLAKDEEFRMLRGVAAFLLARYDQARRDFFHASLADSDEGALWRALVEAAEGAPGEVVKTLSRTGSLIRGYPRALRFPVGTGIVEAALVSGDVRTAGHFLDVLVTSETDARNLGYLDYLEGRVLELAGDFSGAVAMWEDAEYGRHRPSRPRAALARIDLQLKLGDITRAEAIDAIERLRFAWRGDRFEFDLLWRLGRLYLEGGDFRSGLRTMRQAATHFRNYPEAALVTQEMAQTFEALFLHGAADELRPVTAIALYDEFRELTPAGEKGDTVVRQLADRLAKVDLLGRAAELLDDLVKFRLKGAEKAKAGAELARIRFLNREPKLALEALDASALDGLDAALATQRRLLRARVLAAMGRVGDSMATLTDDKSIEAERLRANLHWRTGNWVEAGATMRRVLRVIGGRPGRPVDADQSEAVLNLAVALTLANDDLAVARVRRDYGKAMAGTPLAEAFRLVTEPRAAATLDAEAVANKVSAAVDFQTFMAAFRERQAVARRAEPQTATN